MSQIDNERPDDQEKLIISPNLLAAFTIFMQHFEPACSLSESDEQLTSSDISDHLLELLSIFEVSNSAIYKLMQENGYKYTYDNGFKWLLRITRKV